MAPGRDRLEMPGLGSRHATILPPAAERSVRAIDAIDRSNPNRSWSRPCSVPFARGHGIWVFAAAMGLSLTEGLSSAKDARRGVTQIAADVSQGFPRGYPLLASKSDAPRLGEHHFAVRSDTPGVTSVPVYRNFVDSAAGHRVLHDKPWLVVDHEERSPYRGSIYLSVGAVTAGLGPAGVNVSWTLLGSQQLLSFSRDSGRTFSSPTLVGDSSAFGGYIAVGPAVHSRSPTCASRTETEPETPSSPALYRRRRHLRVASYRGRHERRHRSRATRIGRST